MGKQKKIGRKKRHKAHRYINNVIEQRVWWKQNTPKEREK